MRESHMRYLPPSVLKARVALCLAVDQHWVLSSVVLGVVLLATVCIVLTHEALALAGHLLDAYIVFLSNL
jgi:hypothetical protein